MVWIYSDILKKGESMPTEPTKRKTDSHSVKFRMLNQIQALSPKRLETHAYIQSHRNVVTNMLAPAGFNVPRSPPLKDLRAGPQVVQHSNCHSCCDETSAFKNTVMSHGQESMNGVLREDGLGGTSSDKAQSKGCIKAAGVMKSGWRQYARDRKCKKSPSKNLSYVIYRTMLHVERWKRSRP